MILGRLSHIQYALFAIFILSNKSRQQQYTAYLCICTVSARPEDPTEAPQPTPKPTTRYPTREPTLTPEYCSIGYELDVCFLIDQSCGLNAEECENQMEGISELVASIKKNGDQQDYVSFYLMISMQHYKYH